MGRTSWNWGCPPVSMRVIRSRLKAFFARCPYGDISMCRSSSYSAEEVDTEDNFSWKLEEALVHGLVVWADNFSGRKDAALDTFILSFIFLKTAFNLEILTGVCVLEEGAEHAAFLAVEGFCGSIVEVSATVCESWSRVVWTYFPPSSSILSTLIGLVAYSMLQRFVGGSSSISSAIVWVLPVPAAPKMSALMFLASTYPCVIASSNISLDFSLTVWWETAFYVTMMVAGCVCSEWTM